jgi:hypothetical protein
MMAIGDTPNVCDRRGGECELRRPEFSWGGVTVSMFMGSGMSGLMSRSWTHFWGGCVVAVGALDGGSPDEGSCDVTVDLRAADGKSSSASVVSRNPESIWENDRNGGCPEASAWLQLRCGESA